MASLQTRVQFAPLFIVSIAASCFSIHGKDGGVIRFHFPPKTNIGIDQSADTMIDKDRIEFTVNHLHDRAKRGHGWATYNKLISLWDNSSKALVNFSTYFQFAISRMNDDYKFTGDGLTFFSAPSGL